MLCNKGNLLKGKMIERGFNVVTLAKATGVHSATFYRKMKDVNAFTVGEMLRIKSTLNLSEDEASDIFLN